ncbi:hypothetical protein D3C78_1310820 [compost metagenome]
MTSWRPAHAALYSSWRTSSPQPASAMDLLNARLRIRFFTANDSTQTTWFSLISLRDSLCKPSSRVSAIFACRRATFCRALARFFEPRCLRLSARWAFARRAAYFAVWRGLSICSPSAVTNSAFRPRSMPVVRGDTGSGWVSTSHSIETK